MKKRIAVFFGGRSPEHDVSIVSGLQVLQALDRSKYEAFPVYVAPDGAWLTGDVLKNRAHYMLDKNNRRAAVEVLPELKPQGGSSRLIPQGGGYFSKPKPIEFDVAFPVFHGLYGEDGNFQGVMELSGAAYVGMRTAASAVLMDKVLTKQLMSGIGIPVLPHVVIERAGSGYAVNAADIETAMQNAGIDFPCVLKPSHLGSSIGLAKVTNIEEVQACLPAIFEYDDTAMLEPFVQNLVEYNVAVCAAGGVVQTSAIERPKSSAELLDFKQKYLSGGGSKGAKGGTKTPGQSSEGMLSLTRELNPALALQAEKNIRDWATRMFVDLKGAGAPRIDFISNAETGEIWLNEVNPCPGSLGYFLWEAAARPMLFSELLDHLVQEALTRRAGRQLPKDPVPVDARLHQRPV
jgi:D-alanine-D-alanine ligase